jgi:hypothetical protein
MIKLIPRFQDQLITCICKAAFSNMRKVGKYTVPDLPAYKVNPEAFRPVMKD